MPNDTEIFDSIMAGAVNLPAALVESLRDAFKIAPGPVLSLIQGNYVPASVRAEHADVEAEQIHDFEARLQAVLAMHPLEKRTAVKLFWRNTYRSDPDAARAMLDGMNIPERHHAEC